MLFYTIVIATALLGSSVALPGCASPPVENTNSIPYESGTIPNERQIQIARDLKVGEEVIQEEFLVDGLDPRNFDHIMHAELMLDHVEEKYGETFTPNWITEPDPEQRYYELNATVRSGEYEGTECTIKYVVRGVEEPYFSDSYFYELKHYEYKNYLSELVEEVYRDTPGSVAAVRIVLDSRTLKDEYGPETSLTQGISALGGHVYIYFPPTCELTKEEYYALHEELLDLFAEKGIDVEYRMVMITKVRMEDEGKYFTVDVAERALQKNSAENFTYKWRIFNSVSNERSVQK